MNIAEAGPRRKYIHVATKNKGRSNWTVTGVISGYKVQDQRQWDYYAEAAFAVDVFYIKIKSPAVTEKGHIKRFNFLLPGEDITIENARPRAMEALREEMLAQVPGGPTPPEKLHVADIHIEKRLEKVEAAVEKAMAEMLARARARGRRVEVSGPSSAQPSTTVKTAAVSSAAAYTAAALLRKRTKAKATGTAATAAGTGTAPGSSADAGQCRFPSVAASMDPSSAARLTTAGGSVSHGERLVSSQDPRSRPVLDPGPGPGPGSMHIKLDPDASPGLCPVSAAAAPQHTISDLVPDLVPDLIPVKHEAAGGAKDVPKAPAAPSHPVFESDAVAADISPATPQPSLVGQQVQAVVSQGLPKFLQRTALAAASHTPARHAAAATAAASPRPAGPSGSDRAVDAASAAPATPCASLVRVKQEAVAASTGAAAGAGTAPALPSADAVGSNVCPSSSEPAGQGTPPAGAPRNTAGQKSQKAVGARAAAAAAVAARAAKGMAANKAPRTATCVSPRGRAVASPAMGQAAVRSHDHGGGGGGGDQGARSPGLSQRGRLKRSRCYVDDFDDLNDEHGNGCLGGPHAGGAARADGDDCDGTARQVSSKGAEAQHGVAPTALAAVQNPTVAVAADDAPGAKGAGASTGSGASQPPPPPPSSSQPAAVPTPGAPDSAMGAGAGAGTTATAGDPRKDAPANAAQEEGAGKAQLGWTPALIALLYLPSQAVQQLLQFHGRCSKRVAANLGGSQPPGAGGSASAGGEGTSAADASSAGDSGGTGAPTSGQVEARPAAASIGAPSNEQVVPVLQNLQSLVEAVLQGGLVVVRVPGEGSGPHSHPGSWRLRAHRVAGLGPGPHQVQLVGPDATAPAAAVPVSSLLDAPLPSLPPDAVMDLACELAWRAEGGERGAERPTRGQVLQFLQHSSRVAKLLKSGSPKPQNPSAAANDCSNGTAASAPPTRSAAATAAAAAADLADAGALSRIRADLDRLRLDLNPEQHLGQVRAVAYWARSGHLSAHVEPSDSYRHAMATWVDVAAGRAAAAAAAAAAAVPAVAARALPADGLAGGSGAGEVSEDPDADMDDCIIIGEIRRSRLPSPSPEPRFTPGCRTSSPDPSAVPMSICRSRSGSPLASRDEVAPHPAVERMRVQAAEPAGKDPQPQHSDLLHPPEQLQDVTARILSLQQHSDSHHHHHHHQAPCNDLPADPSTQHRSTSDDVGRGTCTNTAAFQQQQQQGDQQQQQQEQEDQQQEQAQPVWLMQGPPEVAREAELAPEVHHQLLACRQAVLQELRARAGRCSGSQAMTAHELWMHLQQHGAHHLLQPSCQLQPGAAALALLLRYLVLHPHRPVPLTGEYLAFDDHHLDAFVRIQGPLPSFQPGSGPESRFHHQALPGLVAEDPAQDRLLCNYVDSAPGEVDRAVRGYEVQAVRWLEGVRGRQLPLGVLARELPLPDKVQEAMSARSASSRAPGSDPAGSTGGVEDLAMELFRSCPMFQVRQQGHGGGSGGLAPGASWLCWWLQLSPTYQATMQQYVDSAKPAPPLTAAGATAASLPTHLQHPPHQHQPCMHGLAAAEAAANGSSSGGIVDLYLDPDVRLVHEALSRCWDLATVLRVLLPEQQRLLLEHAAMAVIVGPAPATPPAAVAARKPTQGAAVRFVAQEGSYLLFCCCTEREADMAVQRGCYLYPSQHHPGRAELGGQIYGHGRGSSGEMVPLRSPLEALMEVWRGLQDCADPTSLAQHQQIPLLLICRGDAGGSGGAAQLLFTDVNRWGIAVQQLTLNQARAVVGLPPEREQRQGQGNASAARDPRGAAATANFAITDAQWEEFIAAAPGPARLPEVAQGPGGSNRRSRHGAFVPEREIREYQRKLVTFLLSTPDRCAKLGQLHTGCAIPEEFMGGIPPWVVLGRGSFSQLVSVTDESNSMGRTIKMVWLQPGAAGYILGEIERARQAKAAAEAAAKERAEIEAARAIVAEALAAARATAGAEGNDGATQTQQGPEEQGQQPRQGQGTKRGRGPGSRNRGRGRGRKGWSAARGFKRARHGQQQQREEDEYANSDVDVSEDPQSSAGAGSGSESDGDGDGGHNLPTSQWGPVVDAKLRSYAARLVPWLRQRGKAMKPLDIKLGPCKIPKDLMAVAEGKAWRVFNVLVDWGVLVDMGGSLLPA